MTVLTIQYHSIYILHTIFELKYWIIGKAKLSNVLSQYSRFIKRLKKGCVIAHVSLRKNYKAIDLRRFVDLHIINKTKKVMSVKWNCGTCQTSLLSSNVKTSLNLHCSFARFWMLSISMKKSLGCKIQDVSTSISIEAWFEEISEDDGLVMMMKVTNI